MGPLPQQTISKVRPSAEVSVASFESYDEIYKFCKTNQDIGFLFIHESCGEESFVSVFRELSGLYTSSGFLCYGTVIHDGTPNPFTERLLAKNNQILDYVSEEKLTNPE
jgi:hypothetical protein